MRNWLMAILPILIPIVVLSVVGVVVGGLVKWLFDIPDEVATTAGYWIAGGSLVFSFGMFLLKKFRSRAKD